MAVDAITTSQQALVVDWSRCAGHGVCTAAEDVGDDTTRLAAYHQLRQMLSWLQQVSS